MADIVDRIEGRQITSEDQWKEWRKEDLTASEAGALFNVYPYKTFASLWLEKRCGIVNNEPEEEEDETLRLSQILARGRELEPVVAAGVRNKRPDWSIEKANDYWRDPFLHLGATPDFYVYNKDGDLGVMDTKVVGDWEFEKHWVQDGVPCPPLWVLLQVSQQMMLAKKGVKWGSVGVKIIGNWRWETKVFEFQRNPDIDAKIIDAAQTFWQSENIKLDFERDAAAVKLLYPKATPGKIIDLRGNPRIPLLLNNRRNFKKEAKLLLDEIEATETELKSVIGDAETLLADGWQCTLKNIDRKAYEVPATSYRKLYVKDVLPKNGSK
jgi:predicted phage-related endonuclease